MKKTTVMNTAAGALAALLLGGTALAHGVNEGYINEEVLRGNRGAQQQPINRGPTAAEVDAWNRRERQVQSRIAEYRRTPFYMAVAYDIPNKRVVAAGGYRSEARAVEETMRRCGRGRSCHLVATFANTCAMFAYPDGGPNKPSDFFVGKDRNGQQAIVRAVRACEAVHGYNQCSYADVQTRTGDTFCTGYDYSVYGQD